MSSTPVASVPEAPKPAPDTPKSSLPTPVRWGAAFVIAIGGLTELIKKSTELMEAWLPFQEALAKLTPWTRWPMLATLVVVVVWAWYSRHSRVSRLLRPERFELDPSDPGQLVGRDQDVQNLKATCLDVHLVKLTGASGTGKTALVRAGLTPALSKEEPIRPIYIDSYGLDRNQGPLDSLALILQRDLTRQDRAALGLHGQVTAGESLSLLEGFYDKLGCWPLLIFDQFDDYQSAHRKAFRSRNGRLLKPEKFAEQNPFWGQLAALLRDKKIRLLFVSRADMASGLDAVGFTDSDSYPLDPIESQYLAPLFERLTEAGDGKPVVEAPDAGWVGLKQRLSQDLEQDGLVLPVQILIALRGLTYLPKGHLTVRNYERSGGRAGLEVLYVERSIAKCIHSATSEAVAVEPSQVRKLLLAMVAKTGKQEEGTVPQPLPTLARESGLPDGATQRLLTDLQRSGLVRRRDPQATSHNGSAREEWWSLYHDYLARGVRAADRRARSWSYDLEQGRKHYDAAVGWQAKWGALLTIWQQLRLAWHRVLGRFRYGNNARYALISTLRVVPVGLICGVVSFIYVESLRSQESEQEAVRLVKDISFTATEKGMPSPAFLDAVWRLKNSDPRTRRLFWSEALKSPADAWRLMLVTDAVVHATIGLDPDGTEKKALVEQVLVPTLRAEPADPRVCELLARTFAILRALSDEDVARLRKLLLKALRTEPTPTQRTGLASSLVLLAEHAPEVQVADARRELLEALEREQDDRTTVLLARAAAALPGTLTPEQATAKRRHLLRALAKDDDTVSRTVLGRALVAHLPETQVAESWRELLADLYKNGHDPTKVLPARALTALADILPTAQVAESRRQLLAVGNWYIPRGEIMRTLVALSRRTPEPQAEEAYRELRAALPPENDVYARIGVAHAIAALPSTLPQPLATEVRRELMEVFDLSRVVDFNFTISLAQVLVASANRMSESQRTEVRNHLIEARVSGFGGIEIRDELSQVLTSLSSQTPTTEASLARRGLIRALRSENIPRCTPGLVTALIALPGQMTEEEAYTVFQLLLAHIYSSDIVSSDKSEIANSMAKIAGLMPALRSSHARDMVLERLKSESDLGTFGGLVATLGALPGALSVSQRTDLRRQLLEAMLTEGIGGDKTRLAAALTAIPGSLSKEQLQVVVEVLKRPTSDNALRLALIGVLEKESGQTFGNLSDASRWVRDKRGLDVTTTPNRLGE